MTSERPRIGADLLVETAVAAGIEVCFANPGTTEIDLVSGLAGQPKMRSILGLFEGVCSGAADGYARMAGKPALGVFHLGPGFANSLANQHNARRHSTPMVNIIGDQASWHLPHDAPLTSDIDALTGWVGSTHRVDGADGAGATMADAIAAATTGAGRTASVVIGADAAWGRTDAKVPDIRFGRRHPVASEAVDRARAALQKDSPAIIVGGAELSETAAKLLGRIRKATGCQIFLTRTAKVAVGRHLPRFDELPYFPEPLLAALAPLRNVVLAGRDQPVTFFGYEGVPSTALPPEATTTQLCDVDGQLEDALEALADMLAANVDDVTPTDSIPQPSGAELNADSLGLVFASAIPEHAIVLGEFITSGASYRRNSHLANPHTLLSIMGGAIGGGLPSAVGAAVACPDRPVLALQADGAALYTMQSLWTMAREQLDVTVVICANQRYHILEVELDRAGVSHNEGVAHSLVDLGSPAINFTDLAKGFGVPAIRVDSVAGAADAIAAALATPGPNLIEALI